MNKNNNKLVIPTMTKERRVRLSFVSGVLFAFIIGAMIFFSPSKGVSEIPQTTLQQDIVISDTFTYSGQAGVDALALLKSKTAVEQATSGLVTSINGRKADASKREFWSFYVNGAMAPVGPEEYITQSNDQIEWKVETY
jgi:hypothetical protein